LPISQLHNELNSELSLSRSMLINNTRVFLVGNWCM
jgi:hypothetical protein